MQKALSFERNRFITDIADRIETGMNADIKAAIHAFGHVYKQMDAYEKALADLKTHGPRYWAMCRILESRFAPGAPKVLEVGCNTGFLSFFIKQYFPAAAVTAVDQADLQIRINALFADLLALDVTFKTCRAENLADNFDAGAFDIVLLCELLEHLEYQSDAQLEILRESVRACRPDGVVMVSVPYEDKIPYEGHLTEFNRENLQALLTPHMQELSWLEAERNIFGLQAHFLLTGRPRGAQ